MFQSIKNLIPCVALGVIVLAGGCGHEHGPCDHHSHDPECLQCQGDEDPYDAGYELTGEQGNFTIRLVSADPSPHIVGDNSLTIQVVDGDGAPVDGVTFDRIEPFSATGDHGTPITPEYTATGTAGEYEVTMLNYVHFGIWNVTVELSADGVSDRVVFTFCVEEAPAA